MNSRKSSKNINEKDDLMIEFHKVTNRVDDSFVGLKIRNKKVDFYYPETYDLDFSSVEKTREDILAILNTISLAKTRSGANVKIESSFSDDGAMPLVSFLWIIKDFFKNGFYVNEDTSFAKNKRGRISWKRTILGRPMVSAGNLVYSDLVVLVKHRFDSLLSQVYRYCVRKSLDTLGWLFQITDASFVQAPHLSETMHKVYISVLKNALGETFNDEARERISHMLRIIEGLGDDKKADEIVYGVDSYDYVFERMIDYIFGNQDPSDFSPSAYWLLASSNYCPFKTKDLRPDTILIYRNSAYIIDSKYYRYGFTGDRRDLPDTTSIQKQITYGDFIKENKKQGGVDKIRNIFLLPYNRVENNLKLTDLLSYIGFAKSDYRSGSNDHETIHAFLIDLKFVVKTWSHSSHFDIIASLADKVERALQTASDL